LEKILSVKGGGVPPLWTKSAKQHLKFSLEFNTKIVYR